MATPLGVCHSPAGIIAAGCQHAEIPNKTSSYSNDAAVTTITWHDVAGLLDPPDTQNFLAISSKGSGDVDVTLDCQGVLK